MKASIQVSYDRIPNIKIADYKMLSVMLSYLSFYRIAFEIFNGDLFG